MPNRDFISLLFPGGGLNQDDSLLNFPPENAGNSPFEQGDYRYARNVRIGGTSSDNKNAIENLPSTLQITTYKTYNGSSWVDGSPPSGTNKCIGRYEDIKNNTFYAFVYNSSGDHIIYKCQKGASIVIYELLRWSGLNFGEDNIVSAFMISSYLCFTTRQNGTDGNPNPPRIIDTTSIYQTFYDLGASFQEYHISFAKWAPLAPPILKKDTSTSDIAIKYGIFQFAYRYVFKGGFRSTFSPYSYFYTNEAAGDYKIIDISIPGFIFKYNDRANTSFGHNDIAFYYFVEYIELAYRESETGSWKLFKRYTVESSGNDAFTFSNNGPAATVPSNETAQLFDSVPFYAGCGEAIDNRPMFADNTDELVVPSFDVSDINVRQYSPFFPNWNDPTGYGLLNPTDAALMEAIVKGRQFSFKERGIYKVGIVYQHWTGRTWQAITMDKWTYRIPTSAQQIGSSQYWAEALSGLEFKIPAGVKPPDGAVAYQIVISNALNFEYFLHGVANDFKFLQNDVNSLNDDISTPSDLQSVFNDYFDNQAITPDGNTQNRELSDRVVSFVRKNKTTTNLGNASQIYIDVSNWMLPTKANSAATQDNPHNYLFYTFQKGDRVRFYGNVTAPTTYEVFDEEIIEYTGKGLIINKPTGLTGLGYRATLATREEQRFFIEIYRPKTYSPDENIIFWERGEWYPITQPCTTSADFAKRNFVWDGQIQVTAIHVNGFTLFDQVPLVVGDVWSVNHPMYYNYANANSPGQLALFKSAQMTQDFKKAYGRWEHNTGRPYSSYRYIPKLFTKETQARFGLRYLQDSVFNGINTFLDENQFIYPQEYGRIRAMVNTNNAQVESVGSILLMMGEIEVWSVYVNRTTLEDLSGRSQVSISDRVLGSFNTLLGSFGTKNPDSISRRNGRVLWWSQRNGCWVRYSRDGTTDVSSNKMANWYQDIADIILPTFDTTPAKVISVFDNYHGEWVTCFADSSMPSTFRGYDAYKCISFSERDKRWKSVYEYDPDFFVSIGQTVFSLIGAQVWAHERGADYGKIYGVAVPSQWQPVANASVLNSKVWQTITLFATDRWSFLLTGDWRSNAATQQSSEILLADLEKKEDAYVAAVKRDSNTPNVANPKFQGDMMRSRTLLALMTLDPDVDYLTVLNYLGVQAIDSPKNLKN